jgi:hypothetical protein
MVFTIAPSSLGHEHGDAVLVLESNIMRIAQDCIEVQYCVCESKIEEPGTPLLPER